MDSLLPGTEVEARGLRWEVVLTQGLGQQTLYRLRGLDGVVRGVEMDFLSPFEPIEPVRHDIRPDWAAPLRNWLVYHQAFLLEQALGPDALLAAQPGRLRVEPYQLVPVLRALRMSRVRLFLCDSVGLGKTVQAGLVLTELIARRIAHRILIVSPAGPLLDQWQMEMAERFGLRLDVIDRARLEEIRRATELGANPFDSIPLGLVSIDFLKQERVLDQLERASYDVVVIDEAHHCADAGRDADREDSLRRRLAEVLARRCDALMLLTATPHDGNDRSFASLCELLDPSLVDGRGALRGDAYRSHVVRRLKSHIKDAKTGEPRFKERIVTPIPVTATPARHRAFMDMQRALLDLVAPELRKAFRARRYADVLSFISLLKRSVSTVEACRATLQVVAERFQRAVTQEAESQEAKRERIRTLREYARKLGRFGTATAQEEQERDLVESEDLAQSLASLQRDVRSGSAKLTRVADVVQALDEVLAYAEDAVLHDPKLDRLCDEIREIRRAEPRANVLVYTEYVASQRAAIEAILRADLGDVLSMSGEDGEPARKDITSSFRTRDGLVLVSTDAAAEGLNLHQRCHHLIHLELPFNPNRLEQRNGRIDRYGQTLDPIVRYLYLRGTFEERILLRLIAKYEKQRARLTFVPNTLGVTSSSDASAERLLKGIMDDEKQLFRHPEGALFDFAGGDENEGSDDATREVLEEIDRTLGGFREAARTHAWLGTNGLNADERLVTEADQARVTGDRETAVGLAHFVKDAVMLDGGAAGGRPADPVFELVVPIDWTHGLDELPGYEPSTRTMRLTTQVDVELDAKKRPVGFLGRAHPLVRRALDRVRMLSFGGADRTTQDPRASAVAAPVAEPFLLFTFLGRVASRAGREFERVVAVKASRGAGPEFLADSAAWLSIANSDRAIKTTKVWETNFANWATPDDPAARSAAAKGFAPIGDVFLAERRATLSRERADLAKWLAAREHELTAEAAPAAAQRDLFAAAPVAAPTTPWRTLKDPLARLAAFATDPSQPAVSRGEAATLVSLMKQRTDLLDAHAALGAPEIVPLGVLMVVPEGRHGA